METLQTDFGNLQIHPKFNLSTMPPSYTFHCWNCQNTSTINVSRGPGEYHCLGCNMAIQITRDAMDKQGITVPHDPVNHPSHYTSHPSGVECITVTRHMNFNLGNVMKYIWRADHKDVALQDLEKALFYLRDEINRRKKEKA